MKKLLMLLGATVIASTGTIAIPANTQKQTNTTSKPKTLLEGMSIKGTETGVQIYNEAEQYFYNEFSFSKLLKVSNIAIIDIILLNTTTQEKINITTSNKTYDYQNYKVTAQIYLKPLSNSFASDQQLLVNAGFNLGMTYTLGLLINLSALTSITSPTSLNSLNSSNVTYSEVSTAVLPLVTTAVKALSILATLLDFSISIYADASGTAYQNLDLSTATGSVYVKVTASLLSILLTGSSPYIKVTLPIASDLRTNLNALTTIGSPASVTAQSPTAVTYSEIKSALNSVVLAAVVLLSPLALLTDFTYNIYADGSAGTYQNINLSGRTGSVYVQLTASSSSILIRGISVIIKVTLPAIKADISSLTQISSNPIFVTAANQASVTKAEILTAITNSVQTTIQNFAPTALLNTDYLFDIYSDWNKTAYQNINIVGQTNTIFLNILPKVASLFLTGAAMLQVVLTGAQTNLSGLTTIQAPSTVKAANSSSVTASEAQSALNSTVLTAVQGLVPLAVVDNYTFQIYKDNQGTAYTNVNLSNSSADVYVKVTAKVNDLLLQGASSYIKVTLPKIKTSISSITSVVNAPKIISAANLSAVTESELRTVLDPLVSSAVTALNSSATLTTDFTYTIGNTPASTSYSPVDLSTRTVSNSLTLYIQINAVGNSTQVTGSTGKIGVAVYGIKTDISAINNIPLPNPVVAQDPTAVTKTELITAITSQVLYTVLAVEPGATSSDFTFDIRAWDGSTYSPINLSTNFGFVQLIITANSSSNVITGTTSAIIISFPPIINS